MGVGGGRSYLAQSIMGKAPVKAISAPGSSTGQRMSWLEDLTSKKAAIVTQNLFDRYRPLALNCGVSLIFSLPSTPHCRYWTDTHTFTKVM